MPLGAAKIGFWFQRPKALPQFPNPGFEEGFVGWNLFNQQIKLNGGMTILGCPTPIDPTPNPYSTDSGRNSPGDISTVRNSVFSTQLVNDVPTGGGSTALRLTQGNNVVDSGAIVYGPAVVSADPVILKVGDKISFWWKALSGQDAYNVFAYLLNTDNCSTITILDQNSTTAGFSDSGWQYREVEIQAGQAGNYHFVFIAGSFDASFGTVIGASLLIDEVRVIKRVILT